MLTSSCFFAFELYGISCSSSIDRSCAIFADAGSQPGARYSVGSIVTSWRKATLTFDQIVDFVHAIQFGLTERCDRQTTSERSIVIPRVVNTDAGSHRAPRSPLESPTGILRSPLPLPPPNFHHSHRHPSLLPR